MQEPDWAKFLNHLYECQGYLYATDNLTGKEETINERFFDELREEIDFSERVESDPVFSQMLRNLDNTNMIEWNQDGSSSEIRLQSKGFEVAHEREITEKSQNINRMLTLLTVFVAVGSVVQAYSAYLTHGPQKQVMLALTILLVIGILLLAFPFVQGYNTLNYYGLRD